MVGIGLSCEDTKFAVSLRISSIQKEDSDRDLDKTWRSQHSISYRVCQCV